MDADRQMSHRPEQDTRIAGRTFRAHRGSEAFPIGLRIFYIANKVVVINTFAAILEFVTVD